MEKSRPYKPPKTMNSCSLVLYSTLPTPLLAFVAYVYSVCSALCLSIAILLGATQLFSLRSILAYFLYLYGFICSISLFKLCHFLSLLHLLCALHLLSILRGRAPITLSTSILLLFFSSKCNFYAPSYMVLSPLIIFLRYCFYLCDSFVFIQFWVCIYVHSVK